jgi:hypothetical protein
MEWMMPYK